ncbi:MAG: hypothetical protein IT204_03495 [Fimbriimonadaceae bacterium]|nr:hypothetical protein [Fimbriimonadaceae bacterium]
MSRVCGTCGREQPPHDLPVCVACGARLGELLGSPPAAAAAASWLPPEAGLALAARFFDPPVVYTLSPVRWLNYLLVPWLVPLGVALMRGPGWLLGLTLALAVGCCGWAVACRRPARLRVELNPRGVLQAGRLTTWERVTGLRRGEPRRRSHEPGELWIDLPSGPPVRLTAELTSGSAIGSLRNLAELLERILEPGSPAPGAGPP